MDTRPAERPRRFPRRIFGALGATLGLLSRCGATTGGVLAEVVGTVTMLDVGA